MQAIWLENNQLTLREVAEPAAAGNEALIKIRTAGICSTDLELVRGYYPYAGVLGHEFVGEVISASDLTWVGKRVVGEINAVCGSCEACLNGRPTHCENRTVLGIADRDGVFAEFTTLPLANLHQVPDSVSDESAVFTEPLAAALEIQEQIRIKPSDRVLLVGAGRLGQLIAQTLAPTGCKLNVVARHKNQKEILTSHGIGLIAETEIQPRKWDVVVEATGSAEGFDLARRAVRSRGTIVLKSTYKGELSTNFSSIVVDEIMLLGSRCGPFEPALRMLESGQVNVDALIAQQYTFTDGLKAFEKAGQPGTLKVLLQP